MTSPTADQVALAIVEAAKLHDEDPIAVARGGAPCRSRIVAYHALTEAFPDVTKAKIARWVGSPSQSSASAHLNYARRARWWSEEAVDEIVGMLVAAQVEPDGEELPHFDAAERKLIWRMNAGGADAASIGAALGATPGEVSRWMQTFGARA